MKWFLDMHFMTGVHLVLFACALTLGAVTAHYSERHTVSVLHEYVVSGHEQLVLLADTTDRNGADETTEQIVVDCPYRSEFDTLLNKLGTLDQRSLLRVQQLFDVCGHFYAERKALMVLRLNKEVEVLTNTIALIKNIDEDTDLGELASNWTTFMTLEKQRGSFLSEQVVLQEKIISELIAGRNPLSSEISTLRGTASSISESLDVLDKQIDELRVRLKEAEV